MATFDVDQLLIEIGPDAPCGENLEYDPVFIELEQSSKGKAEQQFGDTVIPGEDPDWVEVRRLALSLLERTKDLRIYDQLLRASVALDGMAGLASGLSLLHNVLAQYWETLHPQLDPDDDLDPTARVNIIAGLCDQGSFLRAVREAPLVSSRSFGRFALRHLAADVPEGDRPDATAVNAAFQDVTVETLQETAGQIRASMDDVRAIESTVTDQVGASNAPNLSALVSMLKEASRVIDAQLSARGVGQEELGDAGAEGEGGDGSAARPAGGGAPGQIASRDDVLRTLDRLCEYYARYEPSSPVPVLLHRAKRLVPLSFMDILQDLIPDAVSMAQVFSGPTAEE